MRYVFPETITFFACFAYFVVYSVLVFSPSRVPRSAFRVVIQVLTCITMPIGIVISIILMSIFYFFVLTPVGLVFKLIGRDPLKRKFKQDVPTYWVPRKQTEDTERYFHQS